ncbi:MAG: hypothetical protein U9R01_04105 [candidate division WOR-3 bacterium]|nr:hypothetical protein [candidate division WOR-3 bacterium]
MVSLCQVGKEEIGEFVSNFIRNACLPSGRDTMWGIQSKYVTH